MSSPGAGKLAPANRSPATSQQRIWVRAQPVAPADVEIARPGRGRFPGRWDVVGAALLAGVALWLRVPGLTRLGLYRDDAWPALATETGLLDALRMGVTTPGFELFLRGWLSVSRATLWAQAPALLAAVLVVVGVYALARKVGCGRAAALVAGGLLAVSPVNIIYATRVKPYQFDALAALALLAIALAVSEEPSSRRRWGLLLVVSLAAALFSASTLAVSVTTVAWCTIVGVRRGHGRSRVLATAVSVAYLVFVAAYAVVVLRSVPPSLQASWTEYFISASTPRALVESTAHVVGAFADGLFPGGPGTMGVVALVVAVLAALWYRPAVAALATAPVLAALGLALLERAPFGGGRVDIYLYPCVALVVAMAVQRFLDVVRFPDRLGQLAVGAAIVIVAATSGMEHVEANPYPAADMGPLTAAVRARMEPGDAMVVGPYSRYPFALYGASDPEVVFSSRYAPGFTVRSRDPDVLIMPAEYFEDGYDEGAAVRFAEGRSRVWYLATDTPESDTPPDVQAYEYRPEQRLLAEGFRIVERIEAHGVHAHLLIRPAP